MNQKKEERMEIMTFTGLSCSGKTFLMEKLKTEAPDKFGQPIGITTRNKRAHEVEGVDYIFLSKKDFEDLIKNKELISHVEYHDHYYGTRVKDILELNAKGIIAMVPSAPDMVSSIKETHKDNVSLNALYLDVPVEVVSNRLKLRHFKEMQDFINSNPNASDTEANKFLQTNLKTFNTREEGIIHDSKFWPHGEIEEWRESGKRIKYDFFLTSEDLDKVGLKEINDLYHSIKLLTPKQTEQLPMPDLKKKSIKILTIVGRSASGKSTLASVLKEKYGFREAVSYTSRKARKGEVNGVAYHFVSQSDFAERVKNKEFVEHVEFNNSSYGLHKDEVLKISQEGVPVLAVVEPNGLAQIAQYAYSQNLRSVKDSSLPTWEVSAIWLDAPDDVLLSRLSERAMNDYHDAKTEKDKQKVLITLGERWLSSNSVEQEWVLEANKMEGYVEYPQKLPEPLELPQYSNLIATNLDTIETRTNNKDLTQKDVLDVFKSFARQWVNERFHEDDVQEKLVKFDSPMEYEHRFKVFDEVLSPGIVDKAIECAKNIFSDESLDMSNLAIKDGVQSTAMLSLAKKLKMP